MALPCLDNLVGIRAAGCEESEETPLFYLDQLPGITLRRAEAAIGEDYDSGFALLEAMIAQAQEEVRAQVQAKMNPDFQIAPLITMQQIGQYRDNMESVDALAGHMRGLQFESSKSQYAQLHIHSISLFMQATGTVAVEVWDLLQNKMLDTFNVSGVAGEIVKTDLDLSYTTSHKRLNLFIGYAATNAAYRVEIGSKKNCVTCGHNKGFYNFNDYRIRPVKIADGQSKIENNLRAETYSPGISLEFSMQCTLDPIICGLKTALAPAILYKAGEMAVRELMHSDRLNYIVTAKGDEYENLAAYFDNEYNKRMNTALGNLTPPQDACFKCKRRVWSRTVLP